MDSVHSHYLLITDHLSRKMIFMSTAIKFSERISGKWKQNGLSYRHINCEIRGWEEVELLECVKHGKVTRLRSRRKQNHVARTHGIRGQCTAITDSASVWKDEHWQSRRSLQKASVTWLVNWKRQDVKLSGELPAEIVWVWLWYCSAMTIDAITSETDIVTEAESPQTCVFI